MSTPEEHIPHWYRDWITKDYTEWFRALKSADSKFNTDERDWTPYPEWWETTRQRGIPWSDAKPVDLRAFLSKFTLHDAYLVGYATGWAQIIIAIRPDHFWWELPENLPTPDLLLVCFWKVYQTHWSGWSPNSNVISEAVSQRVSEKDKVRFLDMAMLQGTLIDQEREYLLETDLHHTSFEVETSRLSIFHDGRAVVLVFDNQGQTITLPSS